MKRLLKMDEYAYGSLFLGGYKYHLNGGYSISFPRKERLPEKMTGKELLDAFNRTKIAEISELNIARKACGAQLIEAEKYIFSEIEVGK